MVEMTVCVFNPYCFSWNSVLTVQWWIHVVAFEHSPLCKTFCWYGLIRLFRIVRCSIILQLLFSAVSLCPRMDRRVLSICRRRLPDKTKQLFEWSHMHYNESAIIPPSVHLQMSPRLHRWDIFAPLSVSAPFHLSVRWQDISNMDRFAQTLVGRLVVGHEVTDWCSGRIWRWTGIARQWHAVGTDLCFFHLTFIMLLCLHPGYAMYAQSCVTMWQGSRFLNTWLHPDSV